MNNMENARINECLAYFGDKAVYRKLFEKMRSKYNSLGHIGGSVVLSGLTMTEKDQLGGFLQKNYRGCQTITISAAAFQQALADSRFCGLQLEDLLSAYFGIPLVGKQKQREQEEAIQRHFFETLLTAWEPINDGVVWLQQILSESREGYRMVMQQYREDPERLTVMMNHLFMASQSLPAKKGEVEQLPVFAARITGDPHWFDEQTINGRLLILFLIWKYQLIRENGMTGAEWRNRVLFRGGILKDALSNVTLVYGVHGSGRTGIHPGMEGFFERKEPLYLTLSTLGQLTDVWPGNENQDIYVVENPAVFAAVVDNCPSVCAVCSNGQPRLATLVLLDFLCTHGRIKYAGDFDPEGLVIAQRLKNRYQRQLEFWCYNREYFDSYKVQMPLAKGRLNMLEKISDEALREVKEGIWETGAVAYQERMIEVYIIDLMKERG